jgi:hypothetical protein
MDGNALLDSALPNTRAPVKDPHRNQPTRHGPPANPPRTVGRPRRPFGRPLSGRDSGHRYRADLWVSGITGPVASYPAWTRIRAESGTTSRRNRRSCPRARRVSQLCHVVWKPDGARRRHCRVSVGLVGIPEANGSSISAREVARTPLCLGPACRHCGLDHGGRTSRMLPSPDFGRIGNHAATGVQRCSGRGSKL